MIYDYTVVSARLLVIINFLFEQSKRECQEYSMKFLVLNIFLVNRLNIFVTISES